MSRWLRFAAAVAVVVLLVGTGCTKKNSAPDAPSIQGPASGRPADTLSYVLNSTDPDGDSVKFMMSWGDGASTQWSRATASGADYTLTHVYSESGTYYITAKAKDTKDAESALSDSFRVVTGSFPPNAPARPIGPTRCSTGIAYAWSTKAVHPLHDSVSIQFSWGNGIDSFGPMVASNAVYKAVRTYSLPGTYKIAARARDAKGLESPWSETLVVTVDTPQHAQPGSPHNLALAAQTDTTVRITWSAPADSGYKPLRYVVVFTETGTGTSDSVGSTDSLYFVHNPAYRTGRYQVTAVYASTRVASVEAPSTAPIMGTLISVPELSDTGVNAGYGWNRADGEAALHDMTNADTAKVVDFYVTDFAAGFAGPNYSIASPFLAPQDPGGSMIPQSSNWHLNRFAYLDSGATENDPLPRYLQSRYRDSTVLDSFPILIACNTEDGYFALVKASSIDLINGTADIETWFQLVPGLRLMEH